MTLVLTYCLSSKKQPYIKCSYKYKVKVVISQNHNNKVLEFFHSMRFVHNGRGDMKPNK